MLTIHHLNESRSQRIIWLVEELGLPYRIQHHSRDPKTKLAPDSLKRLHPLGKAPMVERDGQVLAETGFIIEQLARDSDLLPAPGTQAGDAVRYWLHAAEGSAMPPLVAGFALGIVPSQVPFVIRPIAKAITGGLNKAWLKPDLARLTAFWETTLADKGWFAGDQFSAADVMMSYPVEMSALRGTTTRPATADWLRRIHARPAYQRALQAGGTDFSGAKAG